MFTRVSRRAHAVPRTAPLIAVVAVFVMALSGCSSTEATDGSTEFEFTEATGAGEVIPPVDRAPAPSFSGELLDGSPFDSKGLAGDIAVLNFWGSWCAPCRLEAPDLQAVHAAVRDEGVQFLASM